MHEKLIELNFFMVLDSQLALYTVYIVTGNNGPYQ